MADTQHTILIVEDDQDVRESVVDLVTLGGFHCISAVNGLEGLQLASSDEPDLIVTDVMMPEMDGYKMVEALHQAPQLAHIPVIILTAKASEKERIEGLERGAVDYLTKPFNGRELSLKIRNILNQQDNYRNKNWQEILKDSFEEEPYDDDRVFLKNLYETITDKLDHPGFGVPELAATLTVSERNLYRRVKELTGMPVAAYIREIRLQRAHQLLTSNAHLSKSEVSYRVGFKSPAHFSKAYSKRFN